LENYDTVAGIHNFCVYTRLVEMASLVWLQKMKLWCFVEIWFCTKCTRKWLLNPHEMTVVGNAVTWGGSINFWTRRGVRTWKHFTSEAAFPLVGFINPSKDACIY
jgi:hypothetical protein